MSITARLWEKEELEQAQKDEWLATILMNKSTFDDDEIKAYHSLKFPKRIFHLYWNDDVECQSYAEVQAPNTKMLKKFIEADYICLPTAIYEITTGVERIEL